METTDDGRQTTEKARPWRCENGHVLGVVARNGSGIRQLLLYRQAVDLTTDDGRLRLSTAGTTDDGEMEEVEVMAAVSGLVMDVRCSVCGGLRTWVPGEEQLREMLRKMGRVLEEE